MLHTIIVVCITITPAPVDEMTIDHVNLVYS